MTDINNTTESEVLNFANEGKPEVPTFLKVLTILTFIGAGFSLIVSIILPWYIKLMQGLMNKALSSGQEFTQKQLDDMEKGRKALELLQANVVPIMIIGIVGAVLCIYGAILMRKLKKDGFWLYTGGELLPVIGGFILMGTAQYSGVGSIIMGIAFPLLFVLLYALQFKHLK